MHGNAVDKKGLCRRQTEAGTDPAEAPVRSVRGLSVNIVTNHKLVIDKQIVIAVAAIPVLLAETGSHVTVFPRLAPKRAVVWRVGCTFRQ